MKITVCIGFPLAPALLCAFLMLAVAADADARTRRDVYVSPGATRGDGSRDKPYGSIREALDKRVEDWGQVFLGPGVYREDVVVERDGVWFYPWKQYGVVIEGSFTIKGQGIALRGVTFRSKDKAIVVAASAKRCQLQDNRVVELADGGVGLFVEGGALVIGNVVDLRKGDAKDTTGIRLRAGDGRLPLVDHNRVAGAARGIMVEASEQAPDAVWRLTHNEVRECEVGIKVVAAHTVLRYNRAWRCTGPGLEISGGGCTVERNAVYDNGDPANATSPTADTTLPDAPATSRQIHVSADAAPGGDGSLEKPFTAIAKATADLRPGDTVIVGDGVYRERVTISVLAPADAPVVIRSKRKHAAIIVKGRITLSDCAHVRIEGFKFVASTAAVFFGLDARRCTVSGCLLTTLKGKASSTLFISGPSASHNVIEDCVLEGRGRNRMGIQFECQRFNQHCVVRRCTISGYDSAVQTGRGSYPTAPPGYHIIEDCEFFNNNDGVHLKMADGIVRRCHLHHNIAHGITVRYGARQLVEDNRIYHNGIGIRLHSPSHLVRNNVIYANKKAGILASVFTGEPAYDPPTSCFVVNNTFWRNGGRAIQLQHGARVSWLRNVIVGASPDQWLVVREATPRNTPWAPSGVARLADFNLYHNGRVPLLREYEGGEHDLFADPMLVDPGNGDFSLAANSAARNAVSADWAALPPIPFAIVGNPAARSLGASGDVTKPGQAHGIGHQ